MTALNGPEVATASGTVDSTVIFLHGYGADGNDLIGLAPHFAQALPNTVFVSPNAPEACRAAPMGRQWFPIPRLDGSTQAEAERSFALAQDDLNGFIDAHLADHGLDESRLLLIGFSQGAMMSLHVGPRRERQLAGIIGCSGKLIEPEALRAEVRTTPPVLLTHGDMDEMVPVAELQAARQGLSAAGMSVRWHVSHGVGHGIAPDGLELATAFAAEVLGSGADAAEVSGAG